MTSRRKWQYSSIFVGVSLLAATANGQQTIATGLRTPQKLVLTPRGNFLVTEPSTAINSGRVSLVGRGGNFRSFIDGLPSGTDVTGGSSGPTALALRDRVLYLAFGTGDTERPGAAPGTSEFNLTGYSSTLFSSILVFRFSADIDNIGGTFLFSEANLTSLEDGFEVTVSDGQGASVQVSVLANFPDASPHPASIYKFSNPWGLALSPNGSALYVSDASGNSLLKVDTATGKWQRITKFPAFSNPTPIGPPFVDFVPTSVRFYGNDLLVSNLTGFPFLSGAAKVQYISAATGVATPFINGLTSATDVLILDNGPGQRPTFFTLEFSLAQIATPPGPGRLLRFNTADSVVLSSTLVAPVSMVIDTTTKSLFVLSLTGTIQEFKI